MRVSRIIGSMMSNDKMFIQAGQLTKALLVVMHDARGRQDWDWLKDCEFLAQLFGSAVC